MVKKIIVKLEDQAEDFIKNYMKGLPRNFLPSSTEFIKSSNSYEEKIQCLKPFFFDEV